MCNRCIEVGRLGALSLYRKQGHWCSSFSGCTGSRLGSGSWGSGPCRYCRRARGHFWHIAHTRVNEKLQWPFSLRGALCRYGMASGGSGLPRVKFRAVLAANQLASRSHNGARQRFILSVVSEDTLRDWQSCLCGSDCDCSVLQPQYARQKFAAARLVGRSGG